MNIPSLMLSQDLAGLLITLTGQSIIVSLIGIAVIKLLSKQSAPVRSLVCAATIAALGLLMVISIGFRLSEISQDQIHPPILLEENTSNQIASSELGKALPLASEHLPPRIQSQLSNEKGMVQSISFLSPFSIQLTPTGSLIINIMGFIWLTGVMCLLVRLGYNVVLSEKFRNNLLGFQDTSVNGMVRNVASTFWNNRMPELFSSPLVESPIAIGFLNPVIIIPENLLATLSENELKSILLHELSHIYHYDQVISVFKRLVLAFYWWSPFVYEINRHHEQAREEVSDNYVLRELHPKVYTRCLLDLAEKVSLISRYPTAVGMAGRCFDLRVRVEQLLSKKRRVVMRTKLYLKIITFMVGIVLTFGVAGLHGKVKSTTPGDGPETRSTLNPVTSFEKGQKYFQETIVEKNKAGMEIVSNDDEAVQTVSLDKSEVQATRPATAVVNGGTKTKINHVKQAEPESTYILRKTVLNNDEYNGIVLAKIEPAEKISTTSENISEQIEGKPVQDKDDTLRLAMNKKQDPVEEQNNGVVDYFSRGKTYLEKGQIDNAISELNKAVELNPEDASTYFSRGNAYFKNKQYDRAISDYNKAIELDPGYTEAYVNRAKIYHDVKNMYKRAIADYSKAIELNPEDAVNYYLRGNVYFGYEFWNNTGYPMQVRPFHKRDERRALSDFDMAIKLNPEYENAHVMKGYIYFKRGEFSSAIEYNAKALDLNPDNALARNLGLIYSEARQYANAP